MSSKGKPEANRTLLLDYLRERNRPFSTLVLEQNLHGALTKTQIGKILDEEVERGTVVKKMLGKSPLYWPSQKGFGRVTDEELSSLDAQLAELQERSREAKAALAAAQSANRLLDSSPTTPAALAAIAAAQREVDEKNARLAALADGGQAVSADERRALEQRYVAARSAWRRRKRLAMDVIGQMRDGTGLTMKQLKETPGIETDSDCDVAIDGNQTPLEKRLAAAASSSQAKKRARRR